MVRRRDRMFWLDINKVDTISLDIYFLLLEESFHGKKMLKFKNTVYLFENILAIIML